MKFAHWMLPAVLALLASAGCNRATTPSAELPDLPEITTPAAIVRAAPSIDPAAPPEVVVNKFLEALKSADDQMVAFLLTTKACDEIHRRDMVIQPPGKPGARYQIGEVEYAPGKTGAYVNSSWTEDGSEPYEIVWIMRSEEGAWRVAGMAASLDPSQEPLVLNFEDPDDVLEKSQAADRQLRETERR